MIPRVTHAQLTLEVTPRRMPDGSQPFPIQIGRFMLQESKREFTLPVRTRPTVGPPGILPIPASSRSCDQDLGVARQADHRPRDRSARTLLGSADDRDGVRVIVQPTDSTIRPFTRTFAQASAGRARPVTPMSSARWRTSHQEPPSPSATLSVRARAKTGGQIISNTRQLVGGRAEFRAVADVPYGSSRAEPSIARISFTFDDGCSAPESTIPTFTIEDSA